MSEADSLMQKAEKKASSSGGFMSSIFSGGTTSKLEEAADLYVQAANQYRLQKRMREAGSAFEKAAALQIKTDEADDAANTFVEAYKCFRKDDPLRSIGCLEQAIDRFTRRGNFRRAATYRQNIAEIYEVEAIDLRKAMESYDQAGDWLLNDGAEAQANKNFLKVAEIAALEGDYPVAVRKFEDVAKSSVGNQLSKWSVKDYFLKAGICHLCAGDIVATKRAMDTYLDLDLTFQSTRECSLLNEMITDVENGDPEELTNHIYAYDQISTLDKWKTTLLLRIKNNMNEEPDLT